MLERLEGQQPEPQARRCRRRGLTPSLVISSSKRLRRAADAHLDRARLGVLLAVAKRLDGTLTGRAARGGPAPRLPAPDDVQGRAAPALSSSSATVVFGSDSVRRRAGRPKRRRAGRRAPPAARRWQRCAVLRGQRLARAERERKAEEPLHDLLVDLAGQLDPLVQVARALVLARRALDARGQRGQAAQREHRLLAPARRARIAPPPRSANITPSQRPPAATGAQAIVVIPAKRA